MPVVNQGMIKTFNWDTRWGYTVGGVVYRDKYGTYTVDARTYTLPIGIIMKSPTEDDNRLFVKLMALGKCLMNYQEYRK